MAEDVRALAGAVEEDEGGKMPFLAHLGELRQRIMVSLVALMIGFVATFSFSEQIIKWLARPLQTVHRRVAPAPDEPRPPTLGELTSRVDTLFPGPTYTPEQRELLKALARRGGETPPPPGQKLQVIDVTEAFWANMKVALVAGGFLVLPVLLYEVWAFIAPGLLPHERRFALPFVVISTACFAVGVTFALVVIIPFAVTFLAEYKTAEVLVQWTLNRYIDFTLKFAVAFGLIFELPLALTLGARLGLVTPEFLSRNRKYAVLINAGIAAILTPTGDAFNMALMAGPLIFLYEVGIVAARVFGRRPVARAA
jgi:sec-independent protein translocase protein TatC